MGVSIDTYNKLDKDYSKILVERNSYLIKTELLQKDIENLELKLEQVKQDFYFDMRNKDMEIVVLKNQLREARGE